MTGGVRPGAYISNNNNSDSNSSSGNIDAMSQASPCCCVTQKALHDGNAMKS